MAFAIALLVILKYNLVQEAHYWVLKILDYSTRMNNRNRFQALKNDDAKWSIFY